MHACDFLIIPEKNERRRIHVKVFQIFRTISSGKTCSIWFPTRKAGLSIEMERASSVRVNGSVSAVFSSSGLLCNCIALFSPPLFKSLCAPTCPKAAKAPSPPLPECLSLWQTYQIPCQRKKRNENEKRIGFITKHHKTCRKYQLYTSARTVGVLFTAQCPICSIFAPVHLRPCVSVLCSDTLVTKFAHFISLFKLCLDIISPMLVTSL